MYDITTQYNTERIIPYDIPPEIPPIVIIDPDYDNGYGYTPIKKEDKKKKQKKKPWENPDGIKNINIESLLN